jgi:nitrile hydratase
MSARFAAGDAVAVRRSEPLGHVRTPYYVRGLEGIVERVCGPYADPEELAYGRPGLPARPLYRVRFRQRDVWPEYDQMSNDCVEVEIYEHWLDPARAGKKTMTHDEHDHEHHHHDQPVAHPKRPDVEDLPATESQWLETAVRELLIAKGLFSGSDLRAMLEAIDSWTPALGARLVARAWVDPEFKSRLLADAPSAARELGIDPGPTPLVVLENTASRHNLVVCTLCSCYPKRILGIPPDWYKSRSYRSRAVREPRSVLAEFGTVVPEDITVHVHDSTADLRYLVLPMRPEGTEGLSEEALAALATRDSMIGVAMAGAAAS